MGSTTASRSTSRQIFLFTNGDITGTELAGDLLVGHIESTAATSRSSRRPASSTQTASRRSMSPPGTSR
jgi:hypothetical protein